MPSEVPLACSLNARELSFRLEQMAKLGRDALVEARAEPTSAELRFATAAGVRARVEGIVAAEARCCAFLTMSVSDEPGAVVLTIEAPEGAEPLLGELVDAFRADRHTEASATGAGSES